MVTVDELHSEVIVDDGDGQRRDEADKPAERRVEELRAVVQELVAEEFERYLRTQVFDQ